MTAPLADQITLVENHIKLEEQDALEVAALLAAYPELDNNDEAGRCARELKVWKDILETLRRLNIH